MLQNSFFFIVIIPLRVICLLLNPPLAPIKRILWVVLFFALTHFCTFFSLAGLFPSCLFPSIVDDTHIIGLASIVFHVFHDFFSKLDLVNFVVHPHKCATWFLSRLLLRFSLPSSFCTVVGGH
jgi:hypothetical protein